jgi:predicted DNA-binding protein
LIFTHIRIYTSFMKAIALKMREDQHASLRDLSQETGAPVNELIRRAIDEYLERRQNKGKKK